MIGLDTNVLVRYIAQDDPKQSPVATRLIDSLTSDAPGFITLVSLAELVWVMQGCYDTTKDEVANILQTVLQTQELVVEHADIAIKALNKFAQSKADFADCLIERSADAAGCEYTATFDRNAAKSADMRLIS